MLANLQAYGKEYGRTAVQFRSGVLRDRGPGLQDRRPASRPVRPDQVVNWFYVCAATCGLVSTCGRSKRWLVGYLLQRIGSSACLMSVGDGTTVMDQVHHPWFQVSGSTQSTSSSVQTLADGSSTALDRQKLLRQNGDGGHAGEGRTVKWNVHTFARDRRISQTLEQPFIKILAAWTIKVCSENWRFPKITSCWRVWKTGGRKERLGLHTSKRAHPLYTVLGFALLVYPLSSQPSPPYRFHPLASIPAFLFATSFQ